jgi:DNA-binding SARP family transcriptional activator
MFRLLGVVEADVGGRPIKLGWRQERCLLALLLLEGGRPIPSQRLAELIWEGEPPADARAALQVVVARLRSHLNAADAATHGVRLLTKGDSYALEAPPENVDVGRFRMLVGRARTLPHPERAAALLRTALRLWRGPALADVAGPWLRQRIIEPLEEQRLTALEELMEIELAAGRHHERIAELTQLVAEHPLRERLRGQLMVALSREGRRVAALDSYEQLRRTLAETFGLEPGAQLRELHARILRADKDVEPVDPPPVAEQLQNNEVPAELPASIAGFVGRDDELAQLDRMLPEAAGAGAPLVVTAIAGTAGVGKTALAVQWAQRVAHRFPDGQLYVNLHGYAPCGSPVPPVEALGILLRSLGVREDRVPGDVAAAAALFRSLLAGRRVLLLLDNARSVEQVRPLLPGSPGCLVLITTRDRMTGLVAHDGARRLTLDMLRAEQAVALLRDMLGADRVAAEPSAAAELAEACAHLPLALRISAADLINHPHRSIAAHVARLRAANRLTALTVDGEQAVHTALDVSYRSVPADAQRMFRLLGLIPGTDFSVAAAAALSGIAPAEAARLLDRLAAAHLVMECAPDRFTFHDLLRLYARDRVEECTGGTAERTAAGRQFFDWCLRSVARAARLLYPQIIRLPTDPGPGPAADFGDRAQALAWLQAERNNLLAACRHAAGDGYPEMAWLLADGLRGFLSQGGHFFGWMAVTRNGLAAAEQAGDLNGQAAMLIGLAHASHRLCRHEEAVGYLTCAIDKSLQGEWLEGHACAIGNLGIFYDAMGRLDEAAACYPRAIALARRHGWTMLLAGFLDSLGRHQHVAGNLAAAVDNLTESIRLSEVLGEASTGTAYTLESLAGTYYAMGRLRDALRLAERALDVCRHVGNRSHEITVLSLIATIRADLGHSDQALDLANTAVATARDIDDSHGTAHALTALAGVRSRLRQPGQAIELYREALTRAAELNLSYLQAAATVGLAGALRDDGQLPAALDHAEEACRQTERSGFALVHGLALTATAEILLDLERAPDAHRTARAALEAHQRSGSRLAEARTLAVLARTEPDAAGHAHRVAAGRIIADLGLTA